MRESAKVKKSAGITITELIVVMAVLGTVVFTFSNIFEGLFTQVHSAWEKAAVIRVREGLQTYFVDPRRGNRKQYPDVLGSASVGPCTQENICFDYVMGKYLGQTAGRVIGEGSILGGVIDQWVKLDRNLYRSSVSATNVWTYDPATGIFAKTEA